MIFEPIHCLPNFIEVEVACDAFKIGIGDTLSKERHLVAFFSKTLNEVKQRYSTQDKKFSVIVQPLRY